MDQCYVWKCMTLWMPEVALLWLKRVGAEFVAKNSYALDLCERLQLPLFRKRARFVRGPVPRPSQA